MAANAAEQHAAPGTEWLRLLAPDPERLEFATRLALICALTTLVAEIYQTPDPALTVYLAFFLNRPERTMSLILSVAFSIIIGLLIALLFVVVNLVGDDPMWRVISIALISFAFLFLASASRLQPIAGTLALVVGYGLDLFGTIQSGELATRALLYAWLFVGIPAGVSILVNFLLAPAPARTAERAIADRLKLCAAVLRDPQSPSRPELAVMVRDGVSSIQEQLKLARMEKSAPARDLDALQTAALSSFALMSAVDVLAGSPDIGLPDAVRTRLAEAIEHLAHDVERGDSRGGGITLDLPADSSLSPLAHEVVAVMRAAIAGFYQPEAPAAAPAPAKKKGGFLVEDAFTNPEHVQYAKKTTAAAVFCYLFYSLLDWPGIHTCFLTCYIVAQGTAAESVEKLSLRLGGCLIGAAAGIAAIVFLVPALTSIGALMIAVFVGTWAAGYIAAGSQRISYAGFQIAFAFLLCIIQGAGPEFNLTTARDRIIGIIIGNLVAYFALVHVWPVTITRRVDPALAATLRQLSDLVSVNEPARRWRLASQVQGALTKIETDIGLAHYEPASIRSSAGWLSSRRQAVATGRELVALSLISTDSSGLRRRLQALQETLAPAVLATGAEPHASV
jgi:multidrug resistance protein MdtO